MSKAIKKASAAKRKKLDLEYRESYRALERAAHEYSRQLAVGAASELYACAAEMCVAFLKRGESFGMVLNPILMLEMYAAGARYGAEL